MPSTTSAAEQSPVHRRNPWFAIAFLLLQRHSLPVHPQRLKPDKMIPGWAWPVEPVWIIHHRWRRLAAGHFALKPTGYLICTLKSPH